MKQPKTDPMDYDGMGNFSRYRTSKKRGFTSVENDLRNWFRSRFSLKAMRSLIAMIFVIKG